MTFVLQLVGSILIATFGAVTARILFERIWTGASRVRQVREEGGGIGPKFRGELFGGQRKASSARDHGLHMTVKDGQISYRAKSVIAKHS